MRNAELDEAQDGIKFSRRKVSHLRYVVHTTIRAESEEKLKSFLMKVKKECEKASLKLNIQKKQSSWQPVSSIMANR